MDLTLGEKIKYLRKKRKLTQEQLCMNFMDRTLLSKIENDRLYPSIQELEHLSKKLDVPASYFLNNDILQYEDDNYAREDYMLKEMYNKHDYHGIIKYIEFNNKNITQINNKHIYYYLGMSYYNLEYINPSLRSLRKYISLNLKDSEAYQKSDVINFAYALNTLFKIMLINKNYVKGQNYLLMAIKYLSKYNDENALVNYIIHSNLGYAYISTNKYEETISLLEGFLNKKDDFICINIVPDIHNCLSISYYNLNNYEKAIEHVKKSIFFYSYIGNTNQAYACYINYLNALRYSKNFKKAKEVLIKVKEETNDNFQLYQRFLMQEIILNFDLHNFDYIYDNIDLLIIKNLKKSSLMDYYYIKGHIEFLRNNYKESLKWYRKCERYFNEYKFYYDLSLIYEDLYIITLDEKYLKLRDILQNNIGRKNILVE